MAGCTLRSARASRPGKACKPIASRQSPSYRAQREPTRRPRRFLPPGPHHRAPMTCDRRSSSRRHGRVPPHPSMRCYSADSMNIADENLPRRSGGIENGSGARRHDAHALSITIARPKVAQARSDRNGRSGETTALDRDPGSPRQQARHEGAGQSDAAAPGRRDVGADGVRTLHAPDGTIPPSASQRRPSAIENSRRDQEAVEPARNRRRAALARVVV